MSTFGTMIDRIASDTKRSDYTSSISVHIKSAIQHYDPSVKFYTQEHASATATSQEYIALPTGFTSLRTLQASVAGNQKYRLTPRNNDWFDNNASSAHTGDPIYYNVTDYQLRLYPIPSQTSTLTMSFYKELTAVSATADTNKWFTIGEPLIRAKATSYLYRYTVHDHEQANVYQIEADLEQAKMKSRDALFSTEKIKPWL